MVNENSHPHREGQPVTRDEHAAAKSTGAKQRRAAVRRRRSADAAHAAASQAARHDKIRRDHSSEIAEDYVELIAQLQREHGEARAVDLAARLGVSHVTVVRTISRLQKDGLVRSEPYRAIFLTETGQQVAAASERRHQLVVRLLVRIGVNPADAEADAEGIEHHMSASTLLAIEKFLTNEA
jgi:DtxR family manganese transport transcriptional regulator